MTAFGCGRVQVGYCESMRKQPTPQIGQVLDQDGPLMDILISLGATEVFEV